MSTFGKMRIDADGERRITVTRSFDAPREEVFDAYTKPEQLQHWLGVFGGWAMTTCEIEPRIGGRWRIAWRGPDGETMGFRAVCTEFDAPERVATVATFEPPWFEGEERGTVLFEERGHETVLVMRLRYASTRVRDEVLASQMAQGLALSLDKLEEYLGEPEDRWMDADAGGLEWAPPGSPQWIHLPSFPAESATESGQ